MKQTLFTSSLPHVKWLANWMHFIHKKVVILKVTTSPTDFVHLRKGWSWWFIPSPCSGRTCKHRMIECLELEGSRKDHWVQYGCRWAGRIANQQVLAEVFAACSSTEGRSSGSWWLDQLGCGTIYHSHVVSRLAMIMLFITYVNLLVVSDFANNSLLWITEAFAHFWIKFRITCYSSRKHQFESRNSFSLIDSIEDATFAKNYKSLWIKWCQDLQVLQVIRKRLFGGARLLFGIQTKQGNRVIAFYIRILCFKGC